MISSATKLIALCSNFSSFYCFGLYYGVDFPIVKVCARAGQGDRRAQSSAVGESRFAGFLKSGASPPFALAGS
jgi:hypothetical protein